MGQPSTPTSRSALLAALISIPLAAGGWISSSWASPEPDRSAIATGGAQARLKTDGTPLARAVAGAIRADHQIVDGSALVLQISAKGGTVRLAGRAGTIFDRHRSAAVAEGTRGVRDVRVGIRIVRAVKVDGATLQAAVRDAVVAAGLAADGFEVRADDDGVVQLGGGVADEGKAVDEARKVRGAIAIGDYDAQLPGRTPPESTLRLKTTGPAPQQDERVARQLRDALTAAGLEGVNVNVSRGIATLDDSYAELADAMNAEDVARGVPGVLGVKNEITISGRVYRVGDELADELVEANVVAAARRAARGRIDRLQVRVSDGDAWLTGRSATREAAYDAVQAALEAEGVRGVVNALSYPPVYGSK